MKILILSASIGSGHTKAAEAIGESFNCDCDIVDFTAKEISKLNWLAKKIYLSALKFIPDLYDRIYRFMGKQQTGTLTRFLTSTSMYFPFVLLLKKYSPDVIICTHPFPEAAASLWKFLHAKSARKFLLATALTDYSLHEIWIYGEVDIYFVATEQMKLELAAQTRPNQEIFAVGIPIGAEFGKVEKIPHDLMTILIMGGGLGLGSIEETLAELEKISARLKIIVVCGQNEKLLSRLKNFQSKHETNFLGNVENVAELMSSADLLITKPGALTMTEAFAVGLPMILNAPIPGPEFKNAEYAVTNGAAVSVGEEKISAVVERFIKSPELLAEMKRNAKKISKATAAADIAKLVAEKFSVYQ